MENSIEAPQKPKNRTAIGFSNTTPKDIPKRLWVRLHQRYLLIHVYCTIMHNSYSMETAKIDEWIKKI
jgi:hypothetical protein